ncbi:MAG: hypothetical protein R3185_02820 [Candidatus Thermoplasmatota archaeon]|nr:hypothetical protein [Candidatus Thermoplasmatota archaeon]
MAAVPGLLAALIAGSLAWLVFRTRPGRSQNRRLAFLLLFEALAFGVLGLTFLADDVPTGSGFTGVLLVAILAQPWVYLAFLSTLDTPWVALLRGRAGDVALALGCAASIGLYLVRPELFVAGLVPWERYGGINWIASTLGHVAFGLLLLVATYGLLVAISVYRRVPKDSPRRPGAKAYLLAFGLRDSLQLIPLIYLTVGPSGGDAFTGALLGSWLPQLTSVIFSLALAYGILRTQLLEIDLQLKWGLERGTVAGIFVAVFFIVSEGAQVLFSGLAGNQVLGILAAGALVFAIAPLQRLAARMADSAMPGVQDSAAYRAKRAEEIYAAALESALVDGVVTTKERDVLARLQDELGLTASTALAIERGITRAAQPAESGPPAPG